MEPNVRLIESMETLFVSSQARVVIAFEVYASWLSARLDAIMRPLGLERERRRGALLE